MSLLWNEAESISKEYSKKHKLTKKQIAEEEKRLDITATFIWFSFVTMLFGFVIMWIFKSLK